MEEQLRKLVEHAEPKPKSLTGVSGNSSKLKTSFIPPLEFPPSYRYEMALTSLETYYFFPNINNHVKISFDEGKKVVGCLHTGRLLRNQCYQHRTLAIHHAENRR